MSGNDLEKEVENLGISDARFSREAGISEPTLRKIYRNEPTIRSRTFNKAVQALRRLKAQVEPEKIVS